ncbi:MAG: SPFH domain-containing protein [Planctomycetota bacterium]|nr:SPFH domain-containing protein [Planctomycetota bacterium]
MMYVIGIGLVVYMALSAMGSCATMVSNTEVAIIVNNVTGSVTRQEFGGMVFHLPLGLSSVYKVDKSQRVLYLTHGHTNSEHPEGDQVNIKTNDGSNVEMDVEIVYQLQAAFAEQAYRELGDKENIDDILRALTRSAIRSHFGELSTLEISEPLHRAQRLKATQQNLAEDVLPMGIEIVSITAQNFQFDPEYDRIIRDRKEADQILTNQKDYQEAAVEEGKRMVAEATRDKQTALAQLDGDLSKKLIVAEGEAKRIVTKAQQEAYQAEREGDIALKSSEQEAAALEAEGARKAEAMAKLFAAYEKGGEGLVKEALVKFYDGITIRAVPYAPSERVERYETSPAVRTPRAAAPDASRAKKGGTDGGK